jgi:SAM-dependent methyltransferase
MTHCRGCKSTDLFLFLPLGDHPPANGFLAPDQVNEPEGRFPLDAHVCLSCGLIQVADHVPPDFFRHYVYLPSASPLMQRHFRELAGALDRRFDRSHGPVVDIGCNDGTFLRAARELGWTTLGIDPATNIVEAVRADGIEVVNEYLTVPVADELVGRHGTAAVVVTTNTIHHIDDLDEFMRAVDRLLADDGTFVVEVPHAEKLVEQNEFDGIYHEHVSQMSIKSFVDLFARFGMRVDDVEPLDVHGGSIRVFGRKGPKEDTPRPVLDLVAQEERAGLFRRETYERFRARVEALRTELVDLLRSLRAQGRRLAAYGASARGNTVLNYCGIGPDLVEFVADRNPLKQGLYSPGMHVPVRPPEALVDERPDFVLLLAWNFADEVLRQQRDYLEAGGAFILPLPRVEVIDAGSVAA